MAKGVLLRQGDQTECGGRIRAGSVPAVAFNKPIAKEGDPVTCGKDGKTYKIVGGIAFVTVGGGDKRVAGSLDSYSSCPCKSKIIPSCAYPCYENDTQTTRRHSHLVTAAAIPTSLMTNVCSEPEPEQRAQTAKKKTGIDAGFAVLPCGGTTEAWQRLLFTENPPAGAKELFAMLNGPDE